MSESCKILPVEEIFEDRVRKKMPAAAVDRASSLNARLLTAAVEVFLEKGFAASTVDEIATRAKASKITFYNYYGNKEALFEAVMTRQNAVLVEAITGTLPEGMPLQEFLHAFAYRLHAAFLRKETVKLVRVLHAEASRFPELAGVFENAGPARAMRVLALELERHMTSGFLRKADPALAAEHFLHLSVGELMRRVLLGLRPAFSKSEVNKRIAAGIDVFLRAYGP